MKKIILLFAVLYGLNSSAQAVMETTYLDVPLNEIGKFIELHKKVVDMSMHEDRKIKGHWVYRHWYGSGPSIAVYDQFDSIEDAVQDDFMAAIGKNMEGLSEEEQSEMNAVFTEWWSYFEGHTDEMRLIDYEKYFVAKDEVNWDVPFVFVVGKYNTKGSLTEMANAYMDWQTRHHVENGLQMGGGVTSHYKGSGYDLEFFGGFPSLTDFASSATSPGADNPEARAKFWSMVSGEHQDQIYVHVGHLENGVFNLAGEDK